MSGAVVIVSVVAAAAVAGKVTATISCHADAAIITGLKAAVMNIIHLRLDY